LGCCSCRVCVCPCRGCCSLSVCVCELLIFIFIFTGAAVRRLRGERVRDAAPMRVCYLRVSVCVSVDLRYCVQRRHPPIHSRRSYSQVRLIGTSDGAESEMPPLCVCNICVCVSVCLSICLLVCMHINIIVVVGAADRHVQWGRVRDSALIRAIPLCVLVCACVCVCVCSPAICINLIVVVVSIYRCG